MVGDKMNFKDNKGITLIELIVVLALLSIVIAVAFNIFFVSTKTFDTGVDKAEVQQEARLVANEVTDSLKFASSVYKDDPGTGEYYKIFLEDKKLTIDKYDGGTLLDREGTYGSDIKDITFYTDGSSRVVNFKLYIADSTIPTIESAVLLNNLAISNLSVNLNETSTLYYKKDYSLVGADPSDGGDSGGSEPPDGNYVPGTNILIHDNMWPTTTGDYTFQNGLIFEYTYDNGSTGLFVFTHDDNNQYINGTSDPASVGSWLVTKLSGRVVSFENGNDPAVYYGDICKKGNQYYIYKNNSGGDWVTEPPGDNWVLLH